MIRSRPRSRYPATALARRIFSVECPRHLPTGLAPPWQGQRCTGSHRRCRSKRLRVTSLMLLMLSSRGMSTIGFRTAQEVMFVRAARDNAMTAGLQKGLNPGACDLVPVGDYQRGHFAPRRSRPGRRPSISVAMTSSTAILQALLQSVRAIRYPSRRHADTVELDTRLLSRCDCVSRGETLAPRSGR